MQFKIEGITVASITPFTKEGKIDEEALNEHINFLIENGVDGIFAGGTYGEGALLSTENREKLFKLTAEAAGGRIPVISQIGAADTKSVVELNKRAKNANVDAVAAVPPFYFQPDKQGLISFYKEAAGATDLPFFVYNNPGRTGINITPEILKELAKIENLVGIKDSSEKLGQFCRYKRLIGEDFTYLIGSDDITFPALVMGANGAIVVLANVFPKFQVKMYKAFKEKNYELAQRLQYKIHEIREILKKGPYISIYKEAINLLGRKGGHVLGPLRPMNEEEKKSLEMNLQAFKSSLEGF